LQYQLLIKKKRKKKRKDSCIVWLHVWKVSQPSVILGCIWWPGIRYGKKAVDNLNTGIVFLCVWMLKNI
jgi:hypothetical protein